MVTKVDCFMTFWRLFSIFQLEHLKKICIKLFAGCKMKSKMKLQIVFLIIKALTAVTLPQSTRIPEKLRLYQNSTGISDTEILNIYETGLNGYFWAEITKNRLIFILRKIWKLISKISTYWYHSWWRRVSGDISKWSYQCWFCYKSWRVSLHETWHLLLLGNSWFWRLWIYWTIYHA